MKRMLLLLAAALLYTFYSYGFVQWLRSEHDFRDVWRAITSDWFLAVTLLDTSVFALLCIIWLVRDLKRKGYSGARIFLMVLACLLCGVVPLLVYLAMRKPVRP